MKRIRETSPQPPASRALAEPPPELSITKDSQPVVTSRSQLELLPEDLQKHIFEMLRPRALLRLGRTCSTLWNVADRVILRPRPEYTTHKAIPFGGNDGNYFQADRSWPRYDVDELDFERVWHRFPTEQVKEAGDGVYAVKLENFNILVARAARLFPVFKLSPTRLERCLRSLLNANQGIKTEFRIEVLNESLGSLSVFKNCPSALANTDSIALCFSDEDIDPIDVTGLGNLLKSLSLYHLHQLQALQGDLNAIRRCALDYAFLNEAGAAEAVKQRMPQMQELAINRFTPQVSALLDAMPGIHSVSLSDRTVRDDAGVSANGLIRSGVLHLHLDAVEMTTEHLEGLHASPALAKLESLHLVDCEVADVEKLKAVLKDMSALKALQLIDVRISQNVNQDVRLGLEKQFAELLEKLAVRPGLSLEVRQTEDPRQS